MRVNVDLPISAEELEPMVGAIISNDFASLPDWYHHMILARLLGMPVPAFEFLLAQGNSSVQVTPIGEWCRRVWLAAVAQDEAGKLKRERSKLAI